MKIFSIYLIAVLSAIFLVGCDDSTSETIGVDRSTLTIGITDAPIDDAKEVNITITKIEISKDTSGDDGWEVYYQETDEEPAEKINLLDFSEGEVFKFDSKEFDSGQYGQIRLFLGEEPTDNTIVLLDDTEHNLDINAGIRNNGLKLNSGFEIKEGVGVELTIDFDVRKSIVVKNPNATPPVYSLKPTIKLITNDVSGNITFTDTAVAMTAGDVFFLYEADFNEIDSELTEFTADPDKGEIAYENSESSAIAFIDTADNTLKIVFSFMEYDSYSLYKQENVNTVDEGLSAVSGQAGITLSADDNGELIISE